MYTLYTSLVRITKEYNIMILVGLIKSIIKIRGIKMRLYKVLFIYLFFNRWNFNIIMIFIIKLKPQPVFNKGLNIQSFIR